MDANTIVWIVVATVAALIGVGAWREFNRERALHCERCGHAGPFPEREMMNLRDGWPAFCPDCEILLTRRRTNRYS